MLRNLLVFGVLAAVVVAVASQRTQAPAVDTAADAACGTSNSSAASAPPSPKVTAVANVHHFGIINPGDRRRHKFTVRNDGTAPLTMKLGSTTCKCTLANLEKAEVPPGGQTEIELDWHAEEPQFRFRQAAVIETNDPATPRFELAVEGSVRVKLGTIPESVVFTEIPRGEISRVQMVAYSQAYKSIRFEKLESSAANIDAEISGLETDNLVVDHADWARDMLVVRRPDDKSGSFEGKLVIHYVGTTPDGVEEHGVHEVPIFGETVGDVSLHGRHVVGRVLMLGQFSRLKGKSSRAYVHFRNAPADLKIDLFQAEPKFLKIEIEPAEKLSPTVTRIPVNVTVPPLTEAGAYANDNLGTIGFTTSHPDYPKVWLNVSMLIEP